MSILEVCQERGVKKGILGGHLGFLTRDMEDSVMHDIKDDLGRPQGSCPESFMSLSSFLLKICFV